MKLILFILTVGSIVSCSSVKKTGDEKTDALLEHMAQEPRIIGENWKEKFTKDGFINGEYVAIGTVTSYEMNGFYNSQKVNAESIATGNLLRTAPTDFKKVVHRVINSLEKNEGSTKEDQISVTEVRALTGLYSKFDDFQCVKKAVPNKKLKYDFIRECRLLMRVPSTKLLEAYDFTLQSKYGISKEKIRQELRNTFKN